MFRLMALLFTVLLMGLGAMLVLQTMTKTGTACQATDQTTTTLRVSVPAGLADIIDECP